MIQIRNCCDIYTLCHRYSLLRIYFRTILTTYIILSLRCENYMYSYVRKCPYPVVQLLSRVWLLVILWIVACQTPMAPQSSTLAWKIPWAEEPGRLQSMGLLKVGQDWVPSLSLFTFMHWRRKWQPTPVFLPGESQGWGSLEGCRLWGRTESDMTEVT